MTSNINELKTTFRHVVLQGSASEVGIAQAKAVSSIPGWKQFFQSGCDFDNRPKAADTLRLLRRFNPSAEEEISAFCDSLGVSPDNLVYFAYTHLAARRCSHLVALPTATQNGHTLVGRNYDFSHSLDDLRLCSTFIAGKNAHIGFSSIFFGRLEGMNQHGLTVTASVGGMPVGVRKEMAPAPEEGFLFWAIVRALLEECNDLTSAVELFNEMPSCGNPILIIADPSGQAVIAEAYGNKKYISPVEAGWAVATNHYSAKELRPFNPYIMQNSVVRKQVASRCLEEERGQVNQETIRQILSTPYPNGLACHYYQEIFGNLHGMIFDLYERSVQLTFGSPVVNPWHTFRLDSSLQPGEYESRLPLETASPEFWSKAN